jgi:hypothetical protein
MGRAVTYWGAALLAGMTAFTAADPARACGGFFCDSPGGGAPPMPVDQTGETIVFAFDGEYVEAHIQIQYTGDPLRFAWLIPLQSTPEISVGSAQLFGNLLNATVPTVAMSSSFDFCAASYDESSGFGCSSAMSEDSAPGAAGGFAPQRPRDPNGGVVQMRKSVGAFEYTILSGSSAAIEAWLVDNDFLPDDEAPAIVDDYASRGYVFAAIRLTADAGLEELHPLVVRYRGTEPCIPLKLTAIAATEDMAVRAFFLGQRRTVPIGDYRHVTLNLARLDWQTGGQNYKSLVSRAVDSPGADGRAFVTEYAGTSSLVDRNLKNPLWNASRFAALGAEGVMPELTAQGLITCGGPSACEALHPQVIPLLRRHLPVPEGANEFAFWNCVSCYANQFDPSTFDAAAFGRDIEERVVRPAEHATQLLDRSSYLTRLFTTISPAEMSADPAFAELPDQSLGDVGSTLVAVDRTTCDRKNVIATPDGREAAHSPGAPALFTESMPWAERVDEFTADGTRIQVTDLGPTIDSELAAHNRSFGYDPGSPERARLAETNDGCACQVRAASGHGVAFALLALIATLRRLSRRGPAGRRALP